MNRSFAAALAFLAWVSCPALRAETFDPSAYDVVWYTPSRSSAGSMPLGNGDVAANVWVEEEGGLVFYLAKSDAWSGNARLLKLGRLRVRFEPNPFRGGFAFSQRLRLADGSIRIEAGKEDRRVRLHLRVDANHPVLRLEGESSSPVSVEARLELWRVRKRRLEGRELFSAYGLHGAPFPVYVYPDTVVSAETLAAIPGCEPLSRAAVWYHRNEHSIWAFTLRQQGLESLIGRFSDPLLHRTFGGAVYGPGFVKIDDRSLRLESPARRFSLNVCVFAAITPRAEEWLKRLATLVASKRESDAEALLAAHREWWRKFWARSWIRVGEPDSGLPIPTNSLPLRIGADSEGRHRFRGKIRSVRLYRRALGPDEIASLAGGESATPLPRDGLVAEWIFDRLEGGLFPNRAAPGPHARPAGDTAVEGTGARRALRLGGGGWIEAADDPRLDLSDALTVAAWIAPDAFPEGGMRIADKCPAGTSDGYLLDTHPGNGLRLIVAGSALSAPLNLRPKEWVHVAGTYDRRSGKARLYVGGRRVASRRIGAPGFVVSQGYALQRFINACAGRGSYPIKFNGSLFTVDAREPGEEFDADYRRWGGPYWFQNTRFPYWSMLKAGDFDLMQPLFRLYLDILPFSRERTRIYFGHGGAFFPETLYFWGAYACENYGWDRRGKPPSHVDNTYIRHHFEGGLELTALLLEYYAYTEDRDFARRFLLPIAKDVLAFYDAHYPRDARGKLRLEPAQALETWQQVVNPLPDIAGLHWVLERLRALPEELVRPELRARWDELERRVPEIPQAEENGRKYLLPAQRILGPIRNRENPELYAVFPFRLFTLGSADCDVGRETFARRRFKGTGGWQQDAIQAAYLGLARTAWEYVHRNFSTSHAGSRFPAFWGPNFDWIPDQDHGCVAMTALQAMLLQARGRRILLLPAWPRARPVAFRLHAPGRTVVEAVWNGRRFERLTVEPPERRGDVEEPAGTR